MTARTPAPAALPDRGPGGPWLWTGPPAAGPAHDGLPQAVLFDRDGTLVADVPYNGDPRVVRPVPTAREAVAVLRRLGVPTGVVSNQSGVGRGLLTHHQVRAVADRVDALLGPFGAWAVCPHRPEDGCRCRKPAPGLVLAACTALGADPRRTVVIGDIGADEDAARAAGALAVLVPTPATRPQEVGAARHTAPDLLAAVRLALDLALRREPAPRRAASHPGGDPW
ncbi:Phosphoglycolate phosphatase [Streptomyces sp. enrichment culture]|uniref:D-glycero-alpha-D-manno-heptose-1,7-bisphosphate 7-phosphatase n=1 Tax=Streptomyces sp. enrichment culture TaxID=1795815 RepID=UPI003F5438C9